MLTSLNIFLILSLPILSPFRFLLRQVGLPNVGKSTLFNTLTKLSIPAENFPFCTINPNEARVNVPDDRFDWLCQLFKPKSEVSAFLEVNDIAGLVRGANEGEGLGNAFLSHIRAVDGIFHVCRAFDDADVIHVEDTVDPIRDLEIIHNELRLKDIEFMERAKEDYEKQLKRSNDKQLKIDHELCLRVLAHLNEGKDVRLGEWKAADIEVLNTFQLLSAKPVVYLVNLTEKDYQRKKNKWLAKIHGWVQEHGQDPIIPFSGVLESKLADMPADEAATYCKENDIQSGLPKIIKTGFAAINLIYFFTAGPDEVRCWQIRKQTKAPQAAGAIHTDFEKGFICAEVMKFEDLKELGSEAAVKAAGKYKQEGKTYVVQDGDIIFFKFNHSTAALFLPLFLILPSRGASEVVSSAFESMAALIHSPLPTSPPPPTPLHRRTMRPSLYPIPPYPSSIPSRNPAPTSTRVSIHQSSACLKSAFDQRSSACLKIHGTGRRKTAVARVGLIEGNGEIFVNGLPLNEYFQNQALMIQAVNLTLSSLGNEVKLDVVVKAHIEMPMPSPDFIFSLFHHLSPNFPHQAVKLPLSSLGYEGKYDVVVKAHGGGLNAQAQAMVLGIARALVAASAANPPAPQGPGHAHA
ncbi:unnamed protein product [Closterium sp. NIES-64]|nr:unnamed protein product [Closterium sp. NIES-64]